MLLCEAAIAGAWPAEPGRGQIITTSLFDQAETGFDDDGRVINDVFFKKNDTSIYVEHGLGNGGTLVLQTAYQDITYRAGVDTVSFSGLGESSVGIRQTIWKKERALVAVQGTAVFGGPGELVTDADLGFGGTHGEARILYGHSFDIAGRNAFFDAQAAWRYRPGAPPDDWRLDATVGWRPIKKIQILGQGFYTYGQEAKGIARENYRVKLQPSIVYDYSEKTSIQIGGFQTVAGKAVVKEKAVFIGFWQRY